MILPNVRGSFGRAEAGLLVWLLTRGAEDERARVEARLEEEGLDAILDDPRTLNALMAGREFSSAPPHLVFYVLVRHALLEDDLRDRRIADYLTALLLTFGRAGGRAYGIEDELAGFRYLADILGEADRATGQRAFMLRAHLGEFALWLSGLFPDHITARVHRRAAPGLEYYEELGAAGFRMAARYEDAERHGLDTVYTSCAESFPALRVALNRVADRHLFPATGDRIERLLRQVKDNFQRQNPAN
jgi:hypothetical protein